MNKIQFHQVQKDPLTSLNWIPSNDDNLHRAYHYLGHDIREEKGTRAASADQAQASRLPSLASVYLHVTLAFWARLGMDHVPYMSVQDGADPFPRAVLA